MNTFEEDNELRQLLKNIKPEKPASDFTRLVMNRIYQEQSIIEKVKSEPVLGKGFWTILALFGVLIAAILLLSVNNPAAGTFTLLPELSIQKFMPGYRSFFENLSSLPANVAGIFIGFSLLLFLDRALEMKKTGPT